jgi:hypothetical protein
VSHSGPCRPRAPALRWSFVRMLGRYRNTTSLLMIYLVEPPYTRLVPSRPQPPPLGSVLAIDLVSGQQVTRDVLTAESCAPWCPPVLLSGPGPFGFGALEAVLGLSGTVTLVAQRVEAPEACINPLLDAVRRRPVPTPLELGQYVVRRTGFESLLPTLELCFGPFEPRPGPALVRSTINRRLKQAGALSAHDWAAVSRVIGVMRAPGGCVDALACDNGMDPRTLRAHLQRYAGVSVREARERVGWEWLLESVLRVWGYLPELSR